jgi:ectoine hydroxylase-related dioxygenase (phytanoyl-CoA dioxygenase family)
MADLERAAAAAGCRPEIVPIEVTAGTAVLHHGAVWHGSRANRGAGQRRSVVAHCMSSAATFDPDRSHPIYSRYRRAGTLEMDESFFPVLWRTDGYRTPWLNGAGTRTPE